MAQKYNPLLQSGFQEVSTGGGGGVSAVDPYRIPGTITNFQNDIGLSMSGSQNANWGSEWYYPFLINGNVTIRAFAKYINALTTGSGKYYGAIYKLNTDTSNVELVAVQPSEMDYNSTTGTTGWQIVNLTDPVDLTAGIYFMRGICSSSGTGAFRYYNLSNPLVGQNPTNTASYYGYSRFSIPYDFGSTPTTISLSALAPSQSNYTVGHAFYCEIG